MPTPSTPETEPEHPRPDGVQPQSPAGSDGPVTFVPHDQSGAVSGEPVRIHTNRYGAMEAHELVRLLDSIEDERARGRFRESIYISVLIYTVLAWLVLYGPRVLWHAPKIKFDDHLKAQELTELNAPVLAPHPVVHPPLPHLDNRTLEHLRETTRQPTPQPPAPTPQPAQPAPAPVTHPAAPTPPLPSTPQPQPSRQPPPVVAEAPAPQPSVTGGNTFKLQPSPGFARGGPPSMPEGGPAVPLRGGGALGSGMEFLSDTEGVDFSSWGRRFHDETMRAWLPLLPEEVYPPLSKRGRTILDIKIMPDGTIGDMKLEGSTHDEALNRAAWGSITSQGILPPLPKAFHGPFLEIRVYFTVGDQPQ